MIKAAPKPLTRKQKRFYSALAELTERRARKDLFFLAKFILAADRLKQGIELLDEHHESLCKDLMRMAHKRFDGMKQGYIVEWPRGTMKSTIVCVAFPIWILLNWPNARILIDSEAAGKSLNFLKAIKQHIESPLFKEIFGEIFDPKKDWNEERIVVRRSMRGVIEPSVDIGGVEKDKTGYHYDFILFDDITGDTNSRTVEQSQKVIRHAGLYLPLLDTHGLPVGTCTRWGFSDHGEHVEEQNKDAVKECRMQPWVINKLSAFKGARPESMELEEIFRLEPEFKHQPREYLLQALGTLKPWAFYCQYLLYPKSPHDAPFKREWIKWIGEDCPDIPYGSAPDGSKVYVSIDPALTQNKDSDFTAIIVAALKPDFSIYILEVRRGHYDRKEILDHLVELNQVYKPVAIGMESVFRMKDIFLYLKMQAQLNNFVLPLRDFKTTNQNKGARILALSPLMKMGKFYMRRKVGGMIYLEDEIVKFNPRRIDAQQNDCLDAAGYLVEMFDKPDESKPVDYFDDPNWMMKLQAENKAAKEGGRPEKPIPSYALVRSLQYQKQKQRNVANKEVYQHYSRAVFG